ncbi:MAG: extracellular solute-binding protein [Acetivibrio sp.]
MKKRTRVGMIALLSAALMFSMTGCGEKKETGNTETKTEETSNAEGEDKPAEVIQITYPTYRVGTHLSAESEKKLVEDFNKKFEGVYEVVIEELPSDEAYIDKMKVLAASNELPDVVEGKQGVRELAIANGQAVDLAAFVNEDAAYKEAIGEDAIAANTVDGKLYSIANGNQIIGYFYNERMFNEAGITPAKTWEEFNSNCDKLLAAGYTPISMMTGENCWTTNLLLGAMIGSSNEAGNTFMTTKYPTTYQTPEVISALTNIQTILQKYTTKDAVGADYNVAANHFLSGETAMICNGPWMAGDFSDTEKAIEGLGTEIKSAMYPNNGAYANFEVGYLNCAKDEAHQKAAWEFIKFKTDVEGQTIMLEMTDTVPLTSKVVISEEYKAANPLVSTIIETGNAADFKFCTLDNMSYPSVIEEMGNAYPSLAAGDITPEEMVVLMDEAAAKNK